MNFKIKKGDLVRKFNLTSEVFFMSPPLILLIFTQKKVFHEADHDAQIRFPPIRPTT